MKKTLQKGDACLNCGHALHEENFCPECGQLNDIRKPTFGQLVLEALANLFAFDSKFYLTLWPLMAKPGKLSLEVVNGRKTTYLPPIRLFVLMGIIMLLTNSLIERCQRPWDDVSHLQPTNNEPAIVLEGDSVMQSNQPSLTNVADSIAEAEEFKTSVKFTDGALGSKLGTMYTHARNNPQESTEEALETLGLEKTFWNRLFYTQMHKLAMMKGSDFSEYLKGNLLLILLIFIPIVAMLLKVLYLYKNIYFVDHLIFALHTQTAFFVCITAALVLSIWAESLATTLLFLGFPVYLLLALKNFYRQRWLYTAVNFVMINISFFIVSAIFLFLVAIISFILL